MRKLSNVAVLPDLRRDRTRVVTMPIVLYIDDDPRLLELQKGILETNGYTVLLAPDGPTGIALASQQRVDVVVLDLKMPGMDGDEVAGVLYQNQPDLPIIVCTGYFDAMPGWLKWLAVASLQKGDGPEVLLSTLRALTENKKQPL